MSRQHMIGAYGMFWDRDQVTWRPGSGPSAWQLLGRTNKIKPALRVCDFRKARGFYVLFDDFRANYVGLASGTQGIGSRLRAHHQSAHREHWNRFCWFSFDDVTAGTADGWSRLKPREKVTGGLSGRALVQECEALLITVLGSGRQNQMRFQQAKRWEQLKESDFLPGGLASKVDAHGFTDPYLRDVAASG